MNIIKEVYWDEYAKATSDEAKLRFARNLIRKAEESKEDLAGRFCLLKVAKEAALRGGDFGAALEAVDGLSAIFQIDSLEMKLDVLTKAANRAASESEPGRSAQSYGRIAREALALLDVAISTDKFAYARSSGKLAGDAAKNARDELLTKRVSDRIEVMERLAKAYAEVEKAIAVLEQAPDDAEASLAVGKYLCFTRGRWREGLPLLAGGSDAELKALAKRELEPPSQVTDRISIGDAWWDFSLKSEGDIRTAIQSHVAVWYRSAVGDLKGLARDKVEKRLREFEALQPASKAASSVPTKRFDWRKSVEAREAMLQRDGGSAQTERAVAGALHWLARHQNADGSWSCQKRAPGCRDGTCTGLGQTESLTGGTAMGLLPFLAAGQTHQSRGPYQKNIAAAIRFLVARQNQQTGDLTKGNHQMYAHGLAAIALCEAYGMSGDPTVGRAAQGAIKFIQTGQNDRGGWRYQHGTNDGDTSVFGWEMMALKSAQMAGLSVDPAKWELGRKWLSSVAAGAKDGTSQSGGRFSYTPGGGGTPCMSAMGLLITQYMGAERSDPTLTGGVAYLMSQMPKETDKNVYYWYYATQVMHNMLGPEWDKWNRQMQRILIESQAKANCASGSWDPLAPTKDAWGDRGGRLMQTSLSCLTLEIYYRYLPLYQNADGDVVAPPERNLGGPGAAAAEDRVELSRPRMQESYEQAVASGWKPQRAAQYAPLARLARLMTFAKSTKDEAGDRLHLLPQGIQDAAQYADEVSQTLGKTGFDAEQVRAVNRFAAEQIEQPNTGAMLFANVLQTVRDGQQGKDAVIAEVVGTHKLVGFFPGAEAPPTPNGARLLILAVVRPQAAELQDQEGKRQRICLLQVNYLLPVK
jgi:hypothetical protein